MLLVASADEWRDLIQYRIGEKIEAKLLSNPDLKVLYVGVLVDSADVKDVRLI